MEATCQLCSNPCDMYYIMQVRTKFLTIYCMGDYYAVIIITIIVVISGLQPIYEQIISPLTQSLKYHYMHVPTQPE